MDHLSFKSLNVYHVHELMSIFLHNDIKFWPPTSPICRIHPFVIVSMFVGHVLVSFVFTTSQFDLPTHWGTRRMSGGTTEALCLTCNALRGDNVSISILFLGNLMCRSIHCLIFCSFLSTTCIQFTLCIL